MKTTTKLQLFGGVALFFMFFLLAGLGRGQGLAPLYAWFALAIGYELIIVRPAAKRAKLEAEEKARMSSVKPSYVADQEANRQLILVGQLTSQGLSPEQVVDEFRRQQIPCLIPSETWNAGLMRKLIADFSLNRV